MNSKKLKEEVYLSSHEVGKLLGYTHDYISRLCRQGHMVGERRGREWFVKPSDIEVFKKNHEVILQEKKKQLSQKLSEIRKQHEAQKRSQKTVASQKKIQTPQTSQFSQGVKISIPRQFVAICVLACVLAIPTIINTISSTSKISVSKDMSTIINTLQTANIIDSYGLAVAELPKETYVAISTIGHVYLKFYLLQGEALTQTFYDISSAGAITLVGYELIGESFVEGVKNIFNYFSPSVEVGLDTTKKKLNWYIFNVSEGFVYTKNSFSTLYDAVVLTYVIEGGFIIVKNIQTNLYTINSIVQLGSTTVFANISSIFESNFSNKESSEIIKIPN